MDKVTQSTKNITPFGGLNFIYKSLKELKIDNLIDKELGTRNIRAHYSYADIVFSLLGNSLCNGEYISDLEHFKTSFKHQYFSQIPSPDTVEYACQKLKSPTIIEQTKDAVEHQFNFNNKYNNTLLALCLKTGQLKKHEKYTLDFDHVVLENKKQDAKKSYKKTKAYHPSFAFIERLPVHIENQNGNTPARYRQNKTLERCFNNLKDNEIGIEHFRADSASYQKEVIKLVEKNATHFYIRNISSQHFITQCGMAKDWDKVEINNELKEITSSEFCPFGEEKPYRVVVTRTPKKDNQLELFSGTSYNYYGIITNNEHFSNQEIIIFYNLRGDAENSNKFLINDFNLKRLPFMDLDSNTVFMYLMAMCAILFEWIKTILVKNQIPKINLKMRVKAICFRYITVATTLVNHTREKIIKVFSEKVYTILRI